ncbi:MAG: hypothetical protein O6942_05205 [Bacteroidetes bacterium]|nr:hypothetical protein [Bacteroidota bacterium]
MRLYNEKEIGAILKRTAELSKDADVENSDGLSLEELKQLASEAGLDPELVVRAATEFSVGSSKPEKGNFFGGPLSHSREIELDVEVDHDTWESMLPVIREHFKDPGIVQNRAGAFEWTRNRWDDGTKGHVSVQKIKGGSRLHVFWSETALGALLFSPTFLSLFFAPMILFKKMGLGLEGIPIWALIVATFFFLGRFGVMSIKKRNVLKIDELGKKLAQIARRGIVSEHSRLKITTAGEKLDRSAESELDSTRKPVPTGTTERAGPSIDIPDDEFEDRNESGDSTPERELS